MEGLVINKFNNICRFCSSSDEILNLKPLFKEAEDEISSKNSKINSHIQVTKMAEMLMGIKMNISDELPKFICLLCYDKLVSCFVFRQQCLSSIKYLQKKLYDNKQKQALNVNNNLVNINQSLYNNQIAIKQVQAMHKIENGNEINNEMKLDEKKSNKILIKNIRKSGKKNERTVCSICGESYKQISSHMRRVHPINAAYECDFCGKLFKAKAYLRTHFRIHLNVRNYKCKLCDKTYVARTSLRVHMFNHNDERKFLCKICDKSFKQSCDLGKHMKRHRQERHFLCNFCDQRFLTNHIKKRHEILHTNEYPFKCEFCTKSFQVSGALSIHRFNAHTKLNPYKCEICTKTFVRLGDFKTHQRQHEYKII